MRARKASTAAGPEKQLNKALKLLSYRPRSERELVSRGLAAVIPRLRELDLVDDLKFARWWADQRRQFRPRGRIALQAELFQKGVDREIVRQVLPSKDEELRLAQKLLSKKNLDKPRAQRLLLSRGFSPDIVYKIMSLS